MNKNNYLSALKEKIGREASYFYKIKADDGPPIDIIGFDDYPQDGYYTYFSYGLHRVGRSEWIKGRPEYFITIDNKNRLFSTFFGFLNSSFAWEKVMGWNTLIGASSYSCGNC